MDILRMLLGAFILSLVPLLVKPIAGDVAALQMNAWRCGMSLLVLLLLLRLEKPKGQRRWSLPVRKNGWQIFGAILFGLNGPLFIGAMALAPTAMAYLIAASTPAYMLLYQLLFNREKPRVFEYLIAGGILGGLLLFFREGLGPASGLAVVCAVLAGFSWAGYIFAQGKLVGQKTERGDPLTQGTVLLGFLLSTLFSGALLGVFAGFGLFPQLTGSLEVPTQAWVWLFLILLGLQTAIPGWLWAKSIPKVSPYISGAMPTLSAIWGPTWAALVLGEKFGGWTEVLAMIIVHGAVLSAVALKNRKR